MNNRNSALTELEKKRLAYIWRHKEGIYVRHGAANMTIQALWQLDADVAFEYLARWVSADTPPARVLAEGETPGDWRADWL